MLRHERRLLRYCLYVGIAATLLVIAADAGGMLAEMENYLYDTRALYCQHFTPRPTDKLVHLDIDDVALDVIGRWPWPRATLARILNEIRIAGPKAIEMDVLLSESQPVEYIPQPTTAPTEPTTTTSTTLPTPSSLAPATKPAPVVCLPFDNDAELARVIRKLNNVIVPGTLEPVPVESPRYSAMVAELRKDLELQQPELAAAVLTRGILVSPDGLGDQFFGAQRDAMRMRLIDLNAGPELTFEQVRARLLPRTPLDVNTGKVNVLREQWEKYLAAQSFGKFSLAPPVHVEHFDNQRLQLVPIRSLSDAAAEGAFVDYTQFGSPVIRSLPLLLEQDGRFFPQMGLALACRMLDADLQRMRIDGSQLIVPRVAGSDLHIPIAPAQRGTDGYVRGYLIDIPWFGGHSWENMYDWPAHKTSRQHVPLNNIWQACYAEQKIEHNNQLLDDAICGVYQGIDSIGDDRRIRAYLAALPKPDDFSSRATVAKNLLDKECAGYLDSFTSMTAQELNKLEEKDRILFASLKHIKDLLAINPPLIKELAEDRAGLVADLHDKAAIFGWTATASIADFVPTSLHEKCPGVVVHGAIFNGIMTGELWTRSPAWVAAIIAMVLGTLTALAVGYLSPVRALFFAGGLLAAYAVINGTVLFDYGNRIVGAAGPLMAIGVVWAGATLTRVMVEATERKRITRRFSTYADSKLVDYVLETGLESFEGEDREVTVAFTDFANFTALSERLGAKIVPLLNDLLGELVPVIREGHQGYVNKFMGDGIMFFYNAPRQVHNHAPDAVATVLDMQVKLAEFNERLRKEGLPLLAMRGGIASGMVVVGDAGYAGRSDYTRLGDSVNLASRLEGANKVTGTHTLINDRAAELLNGQFLIRPIGKIQAVGKEVAVMCYEPIAKTVAATDKQRELATITARLVDAFVGARFHDCLKIAGEMELLFGPAKLAALYRSMCERYLREPPPADFDGRIVLTEK